MSKDNGVKKVFWESGLEIDTVYDRESVEKSGGVGSIGKPGEFPFTRGIHPQMYRKRPWTMRQYSGFGTAAETHERFLYLIANGQTGLNVAFDLPTQCGLDSDDPMATGEVGRVGMAIDTLEDVEEAFADIPLNDITVSLTINGAAVPIMAMYFAMARKRGYDLRELRGTAQNDILKEFIGRGTWIFPVEHSVKLVGDTIEFCAQNAPKYSATSVCGYHIRESGANPAQEMAFALAIAMAYIDHVKARGLSVDDFAGTLSFNFNIHGNIWEQVAKFRAGRRLYAMLLKERHGVANDRAMMMRMIAGGGGGGLTIQQPENNIIRGAYYALISALGGTQTMALCSYDEAYTIPSAHAAKISLRTMQILMDEAGLTDTVDPLAGSFFMETMTNEMEKEMRKIIDRLDAEGGIVKGIETGRIQSMVNRQAYELERRIQSGDFKKVGVNEYIDEEEKTEIEFHPYREQEAKDQIARLKAVREKRDDAKADAATKALRNAAMNGKNVMPFALDAAEVLVTVGEMTKALVDVYGRYNEPVVF
ncbi:MAG: methylmalonyl-CoA mutase family protein [Planctomycetes bacterium]|nr:methylmalonyl-CoA mutase family protein [Planctomycetota bacterium]